MCLKLTDLWITSQKSKVAKHQFNFKVVHERCNSPLQNVIKKERGGDNCPCTVLQMDSLFLHESTFLTVINLQFITLTFF